MKIFETEAALAQANLQAGQLVRTKGYENTEDGISTLWRIAASGQGVTLANGNVAVPYSDGAAKMRKNYIINGDFSVAQRGTDFPNHSAGYHLDRWYSTSGRDIFKSTEAPPNSGLVGSVLVDNGTGSSLNLRQSVELAATGKAGVFGVGRTFTISGYVKVNQVGRVINLAASFTDGPNFGGRVDLFSIPLITGDGDWQYVKHTFTVDVSPASTNTSFTIQFSSDADSVLTEARFAGVQLEDGPVDTPFEFLQQQEKIALCQRYYFRSPYNWIRLRAANPTGSNITHRTTMALPQRMRTAPTCSITGYQNNEQLGSVPLIYNAPEEQFISRDTVGIYWVPLGNATYWGFAIGIEAEAEL